MLSTRGLWKCSSGLCVCRIPDDTLSQDSSMWAAPWPPQGLSPPTRGTVTWQGLLARPRVSQGGLLPCGVRECLAGCPHTNVDWFQPCHWEGALPLPAEPPARPHFGTSAFPDHAAGCGLDAQALSQAPSAPLSQLPLGLHCVPHGATLSRPCQGYLSHCRPDIVRDVGQAYERLQRATPAAAQVDTGQQRTGWETPAKHREQLSAWHKCRLGESSALGPWPFHFSQEEAEADHPAPATLPCPPWPTGALYPSTTHAQLQQ